MKRIGVFALLFAMCLAGSIPAGAQRMTPEENARQSRAAAKQQQKMLKKANKTQQKSMKKYEKQQRKAVKKGNHHPQHYASR